MKKYDVVIVGAGTAGLTARREVAKKTDNYILVEKGELGTTCARVGCMPSKVLIQVANDFHRRSTFHQSGIKGGDHLSIDPEKVMNHVRSLRDRFVRSVLSDMDSWKENHFVKGEVKFIDDHTLSISGEEIKAEKIILGVGSRPAVPKQAFVNSDPENYKNCVLTTDDFFEMDKLPDSVAVFGLGVIGIELGQALARLGVDVQGVTYGKAIGGISDEEIQDYVLEKMRLEFPISTYGGKIKSYNPKTKKVTVVILGQNGETLEEKEVDKVILSVGRRSNSDLLGLEKTSAMLSEKGIPEIDQSLLSLKGAGHIFMPGDSNGDRPVLHEASDEGIIAGYNSVNPEQCFARKKTLNITFCDPNIATVGLRRSQIKEEYVEGKVSFEGQGRSIVKLKEKGLLKVFVSKDDHKILGAEIFAPDGEHLAHLLSWSLSMNHTVFDVLKMPFYHPVIEEGLRTALRDAAKKLKADGYFELLRCQETIVD